MFAKESVEKNKLDGMPRIEKKQKRIVLFARVNAEHNVWSK